MPFVGVTEEPVGRMIRVRRYATATFTDVDEDEGEDRSNPLRLPVFVWGSGIGRGRCETVSHGRSVPVQDERSWLVAWEGTPDQREEIRSRFLELDGPLAWDDTLMPELPMPTTDGIRIQTNCYESMAEELEAFGL